MEIVFDPAKRAATLLHRRLDFADASEVFAGAILEYPDDRFGYGEERTITVGLLRGSVVVIVWTERGEAVRVISMRHATKGEANEYFRRVG